VSDHPLFTTHRRLGPGAAVRAGAVAPYRALAITAGEPHVLRDELVGRDPSAEPAASARPLLVLAHVTDLQLADVQSPTRFEFLNREWGDPRYAGIVPVQRPQEALTVHAVDATLRTLNGLPGGPATGAPIQLAVTTGDAIDNAQWNEVQTFLALFEGGTVRSRSGGSRDQTSSDATMASRTTPGCSNARWRTSRRPVCACPGWLASATTRH